MHLFTAHLLSDYRPDSCPVLSCPQAFRIGRYPLHFHTVTESGGVGDLSGVHVLGVSVHFSFNRGINVHGGTGALVESSTIYNNLGHAFFLEVMRR